MSAIEVLKKEKEYMKLHCGSISNGQWIPRDLRLAFDEALLALEQKEKLVEWLEKEIRKCYPKNFCFKDWTPIMDTVQKQVRHDTLKEVLDRVGEQK